MLSQAAGNNSVNLPVPESRSQLRFIRILHCLIGKTLLLRQCSQVAIAAVAAQNADGHSVKAAVIIQTKAVVPRTDAQLRIAGADGSRKGKFLFSLTGFSCRCHHVNLTGAQHLLHFLPAIFVADILIVQICVFTEKLKKIESVPTAMGSILVLVDLVIPRKSKITDADRFGFSL